MKNGDGSEPTDASRPPDRRRTSRGGGWITRSAPSSSAGSHVWSPSAATGSRRCSRRSRLASTRRGTRFPRMSISPVIVMGIAHACASRVHAFPAETIAGATVERLERRRARVRRRSPGSSAARSVISCRTSYSSSTTSSTLRGRRNRVAQRSSRHFAGRHRHRSTLCSRHASDRRSASTGCAVTVTFWTSRPPISRSSPRRWRSSSFRGSGLDVAEQAAWVYQRTGGWPAAVGLIADLVSGTEQREHHDLLRALLHHDVDLSTHLRRTRARSSRAGGPPCDKDGCARRHHHAGPLRASRVQPFRGDDRLSRDAWLAGRALIAARMVRIQPVDPRLRRRESCARTI